MATKEVQQIQLTVVKNFASGKISVQGRGNFRAVEFDTTDNKFRDELLVEPLDIQGQVESNAGRVAIPTGPGIGVEPDRDFINYYSIDA